MPQRVVHSQTGARHVPEGGRGVIPNGFPLGVIPRPYFITNFEAVRLGNGRTGVITCPGAKACDPRCCRPGRAPVVRDDGNVRRRATLPTGRGVTVADMQSGGARRGTSVS